MLHFKNFIPSPSNNRSSAFVDEGCIKAPPYLKEIEVVAIFTLKKPAIGSQISRLACKNPYW
jgi:hypothetical protein